MGILDLINNIPVTSCLVMADVGVLYITYSIRHGLEPRKVAVPTTSIVCLRYMCQCPLIDQFPSLLTDPLFFGLVVGHIIHSLFMLISGTGNPSKHTWRAAGGASDQMHNMNQC